MESKTSGRHEKWWRRHEAKPLRVTGVVDITDVNMCIQVSTCIWEGRGSVFQPQLLSHDKWEHEDDADSRKPKILEWLHHFSYAYRCAMLSFHTRINIQSVQSHGTSFDCNAGESLCRDISFQCTWNYFHDVAFASLQPQYVHRIKSNKPSSSINPEAQSKDPESHAKEENVENTLNITKKNNLTK